MLHGKFSKHFAVEVIELACSFKAEVAGSLEEEEGGVVKPLHYCTDLWWHEGCRLSTCWKGVSLLKRPSSVDWRLQEAAQPKEGRTTNM